MFKNVRATAWGLALVAGLGVSAMADAQAVPPSAAIDGTRLELQARGVVRVVPDQALITAGVVTQAPEAQAAMRANAARMAGLRKALQAAGIPDKDVRTESLSLTPQYRYAPNEAPVITGYQASNLVRISLSDIARAGKVIDALVQQGANDITGPSFVLSNRTPAENEARQAALQLVQARAALYAQAMGVRVRRILSLSETVEMGAPPLPMSPMRVLAADGGAAQTSLLGGAQEVAVTLSAVVDLGPLP